MTEQELAETIAYSAIPKGKEKLLGYDDNIDFGRRMAKKVTKPTDEIKEPTGKERAFHSLVGGLTSITVAPLLSKLLRQKVNRPLLLANTAGSMALGYFSPDIANIIRKEVRGDIEESESRKLISDYNSHVLHAEDRAKELSDFFKERINSGDLKKESSIAGAISKGVSKVPGFAFKRTFPGKDAGAISRYVGYGLKTGIVGGGSYLGYKGYRKFKKPNFKPNYTTFLRNNVISGNIKPSELSRNDMVAVRRLGLK